MRLTKWWKVWAKPEAKPARRRKPRAKAKPPVLQAGQPGIAGALGELMSTSKAEVDALAAKRAGTPRVEFYRDGPVTRARYIPDWETVKAHVIKRAAAEPFVDHPGAGLPPGPEPHGHGPLIDGRMADRMARWLAARGIPPVIAHADVLRSGYATEEVLSQLPPDDALAPDLFDALDRYQRWVKSIQMVAELHLRRLGLAP